MRCKRWILMCMALMWTSAAMAQLEGWTVSHAYGISTPNNFNMPEQTRGAVGVEVGWRHRMSGAEWWMQHRHYPTFGLKASALFVPNGIAGHRLGVAGYMWTPFWGHFSTHWGVGLSSYTHSAYFTHDTANIYITTLLTCLIDIGLDYQLTDQMLLSLSFMHASNGKTHYPNKGLNYLLATMEYGIKPYVKPHMEEEPLPTPAFARHELGFTLSGGVAHEDLIDGKLYGCYDVSLNYDYYLNPVFAMGGTIDLWFVGNHWDNIQSGEYTWTLPVYGSAAFTLEGFWGNLNLRGSVGSVLFAPKEARIMWLYERAGVYYNWGNNYVGLAINAHAGRAEFVEWSYGRRFKVRSAHRH